MTSCEDAPEHDRYAAWLRALTASDEPFALSDAVLSAFLRWRHPLAVSR